MENIISVAVFNKYEEIAVHYFLVEISVTIKNNVHTLEIVSVF